MSFYFYGDQLDESKLQKAVDLSIEKYCGVLEMFRQFSEVSIETFFNKEQ
jgi:putative redox protein